MELGKINEFKVVSKTDTGHFISLSDIDGDDPNQSEEIFMPHLKRDREKSMSLQVGDVVEAFVYKDEKLGIQASLDLPYAEVNEFVVLKCVGARDFGAFLDWGLESDLFVPIKNQKETMEHGKYYLIRICFDAENGKVYGTTKFGSFLSSLDIYLKEGDQIEIIPAEDHKLGYRCIINREFLGMLYRNEIFTEIEFDKAYHGYVKKIREDGLIDATLQPVGTKRVLSAQDQILEYLKANGGESSLHDKSSPAEIKQELGISKQAFKNAIGRLYKERKIIISRTGISLVK
jgi:predicted RNA-binding protein (virulence factor B family)